MEGMSLEGGFCMKEITLALGGGGVKGHAHIGVVRVLERHGYLVRAIAGTSAGGLWGSLYAFGYTPDDIQRRLSIGNQDTLFGRRPEDGPSWLGVNGLRKMLEELLGDCEFKDLRMPFAVTAVDLNSAERVVLRSGRVIDAVLATIAVPGVFPPAVWHTRTLVDGGVLDPVPIGLARSLAPDLPVLAVALSPPMTEWNKLDPPRLLSGLPILNRYIDRFRFTQALNIFMRSIDIGGALLTELLLELEQPDVLVRPIVRQIGLLDEVNPAEVAILGEQAMEQAMPELEHAVRWTSRLTRKLRPRYRLKLLASENWIDGRTDRSSFRLAR
jgi:NTE family protein